MQDVQKIIVLDYGSQYSQLISRRIREFGVFSELKSHKISGLRRWKTSINWIVLSGGPNSVYAENAFDIDTGIFGLGIPILGICYGMRLITHKVGIQVVPAGEAGNREYGQSTLQLKADSALFAGTPAEQVVHWAMEMQSLRFLLTSTWLVCHQTVPSFCHWKYGRENLWYPIPPRSSSFCVWKWYLKILLSTSAVVVAIGPWKTWSMLRSKDSGNRWW